MTGDWQYSNLNFGLIGLGTVKQIGLEPTYPLGALFCVYCVRTCAAHYQTYKEKLYERLNLPFVRVSGVCIAHPIKDFDQFGKPVMTAECLYRSDLFELQIEVSATIKETRGQRVS